MKTPTQMNPIAIRLMRALRKVKTAQVVDLRAFREGTARAAELQKSVAQREDLADFHPAHALYVYVPDAHKWDFKARFRSGGFGWKSQPAITAKAHGREFQR